MASGGLGLLHTPDPFLWTQQKTSGGSTVCLLPLAGKDRLEAGHGEDARMALPTLAFSQ